MSNLVDKIIISGLNTGGKILNKDALINAAKAWENKDVNFDPDNIRPTYHFPTYDYITNGLLNDMGIDVIANDVDGNLMGYHDTIIEPSFLLRFEDHKRNFKMYIVSNSGEKRYRELGMIFKDIPVIKLYKPESSDDLFYRVLLNGKDTVWTKSDDGKKNIVYQSNLVYDSQEKKYEGPLSLRKRDELPKPNALLNQFIMEEEGISDPEKIVWIGDRLFTEISTAGQAGAKSIWVDQFLGKRKEPLTMIIPRMKEAKMAKKYGFDSYTEMDQFSGPKY